MARIERFEDLKVCIYKNLNWHTGTQTI